MITLQKENNTVLVYKNLVTDELPEDVQVFLTSRDKSYIVTGHTTLYTHFYLVTFSDDISPLPSEANFSVRLDGEIYYTEKAIIKK